MSLLSIGQKRPGDSPADLILECHTRIRKFSALAVRIASEDAPDLLEAAAQVHRYFTVALPLHVADEELSVAPRLGPLEALAKMEREHRAHEPLLARLIPAWAGGELRNTLADALQLQRDLEEHLAAEEQTIVPLLARLPISEARAVLDEMRARRSSA